jgi:hypothetical protein
MGSSGYIGIRGNLSSARTADKVTDSFIFHLPLKTTILAESGIDSSNGVGFEIVVIHFVGFTQKASKE